MEGTCPSAHPILRTYVPVRTLSLPSALLDFGNAHAQPFSYIRGRLLILAHTQSHLLKTCASLEIESNHTHPQKFVLQSCTRVYLRSISVSSRFPFTSHSLPLFLPLFLSLSHSQDICLVYLPYLYIHTYIHTYTYKNREVRTEIYVTYTNRAGRKGLPQIKNTESPHADSLVL